MPAVRSYGKAGKPIKISLPGAVIETLKRARFQWERESVPSLIVELVIKALAAQGVNAYGRGEGVTAENALPPTIAPEADQAGPPSGQPRRARG